MIICTKYLPGMSYGPMWNMVITRHSDLCYKNWWKNILYVQNLFGFKNMVKVFRAVLTNHIVQIDSFCL
jgi:hypothetical protein